MRKRRIFLILIYILLLIGCLGIVHIVDVMVHPKLPVETPETSDEEQETRKPATPSTPSVAVEEKQKEIETGYGNEEKDTWWRGYLAEEKDIEPTEEPTETEEDKGPPRVVFASDLHYFSPEITDYGSGFFATEARDDGKAMYYSGQVIDALLAEVMEEKPTALVLSGDITFNGEKKNHEGLAEKLQALQDQGVQVLVVPGNHDINNPMSGEYFGAERIPAPSVDGNGFYEIYHNFGYDQSYSRDEDSLSYIYQLDDENWLMLLDTCQYEPRNMVNGRIQPGTLTWMERMLEEAKEKEINVIPVGHHNLLSESRLYVTDCTMENHLEICELLERYHLPLYISGHLHAQRIKKHKVQPGVSDQEYGISEIVLSPLSLAPHQYGILEWTEEGHLQFETRRTDVEAWAWKQDPQKVDEYLLNYTEYGESFLKKVIHDQIYWTLGFLPEEQKQSMAGLYAGLYYDYCAGNWMDEQETVETSAYFLWERNLPDSVYVKRMHEMLEDTRKEHKRWEGEVFYKPQPETDLETEELIISDQTEKTEEK